MWAILGVNAGGPPHSSTGGARPRHAGGPGRLGELRTQGHGLPEILEAGEALEPQLAPLAAARRTDADLAAMAEALDAMTADIQDGGLGEEGDRLFHQAVTRAARSPLLAEFMAAIAAPIAETRRFSLAEPALPPRSPPAHPPIPHASPP